MNNILAAKVLISHLPEITDGAYKRATEIAIEVLFQDALNEKKSIAPELTACEYLGITKKEYDYWLCGIRETAKLPIENIEEEINKFSKTNQYLKGLGF